MRYKTGHRKESKEKILLAIGRGFRKRGFEGIGVDGLAKEAGVTSGAFYGHFRSKNEAFKEALQLGLKELSEGIEDLQTQHGPNWIEAFIDFYLGFKRTCDLTEACAFQSLTPEVIRSGHDVREIYEIEVLKVIATIAKGLPQSSPSERRSRAWALMSMLSGAVSTARALTDEKLGTQIAKALRSAAILIAKN